METSKLIGLLEIIEAWRESFPNKNPGSDDYSESLDLAAIQDIMGFMLEMDEKLGERAHPIGAVLLELEAFCKSYSQKREMNQTERMEFVEDSLDVIKKKFWPIHNEIMG